MLFDGASQTTVNLPRRKASSSASAPFPAGLFLYSCSVTVSFSPEHFTVNAGGR